jgi:hypothetical protein
MELIWEARPLTVAELCAAIAERRVPATTRDGQVEVRARDLRRLGYEAYVGRRLTLPPRETLPPRDHLDCSSLDPCGLA